MCVDCMNDLFPHIDRKVYNRTFLQQVDVRLIYPTITRAGVSDTFINGADTFFQNHFGINVDLNQLMDKSVFLEVENKQIAFIFSSAASMLSVGYKDYRTFYDSVLPNVYPVKEFVFNLLGVGYTDVYVRKLNVFTFDVNEDIDIERNKRLIYQNVFSEEFLNHAVERDNVVIRDCNTEIEVRRFKNEKKELLCRTYILPHEEKGAYALFLDNIIRFSTDSNALEINLQEVNNVLYDAFHWAVNDEVIDIMDKEDRK